MVLTPQCFNNLKDVRVSKTQEFRGSFSRMYRNLSDLNSVQSDLRCYHGHKSDPRWMDTEPGDTAPPWFMDYIFNDDSQKTIPSCSPSQLTPVKPLRHSNLFGQRMEGFIIALNMILPSSLGERN